MTKFFLPGAASDQQVERQYQSIKEFVERQWVPLHDRRIFYVEYLHNGVQCSAEVGKPHHLNREPVVAIFKAQNYRLYYVCTTSRGVVEGSPIPVLEQNVITTKDFDPESS